MLWCSSLMGEAVAPPTPRMRGETQLLGSGSESEGRGSLWVLLGKCVGVDSPLCFTGKGGQIFLGLVGTLCCLAVCAAWSAFTGILLTVLWSLFPGKTALVGGLRQEGQWLDSGGFPWTLLMACLYGVDSELSLPSMG